MKCLSPQKKKSVRPPPGSIQCTEDMCFEVEDRIQCNASQKVMYKTRKDYCISLVIPLEKPSNFAAAQAWEVKRAELEATEDKIEPKDCVKYSVDLADCLTNIATPGLCVV